MRSRTNFVLVLLTISTFIGGAILENWIFLVLAIANLSILSIGNSGAISSDVKLKVERKTEKMSIYEGDETWVELSIKNQGDRLRYLEVMDLLPSDTKVVAGSNHHILKFEKGEQKTLRYKISCQRRGKTKIGPIKLRYRDPLNLYIEEWTSEKLLTIFVLPDIQDMDSVNVRPFYTRNWIGNIRSQNIGVGTEFFSLREYNIEDDIKKINWKATARYLEPMTNEFMGERSGDVIIIIDGHAPSNIGNEEFNTIDASIQAAGTLASSILSDRNRVGLIVLGDYLDWLYPDSGRDHFYKIMERLSAVESGGVWELQDTKWLLKRFFPNKSMIIFISPLLSEKISDTIVDICMKEYNVMIISPNPVEIERDIIDDRSPLAERLSLLKREMILDKLRNYSIVLDWDPKEPIEAGLEEVIRYWKRR